MWKRLTLSCLLVLTLIAPAAIAAETSGPAKLDLFLLVGQSNMAGRGHVQAQDMVPDPKVWMLTKAEAWSPAVDPMHFDKPKVVGVGPGRTFGIAVAARTNADVGLVPCAVGGTSINQWQKDGPLYTDAIHRAKAALARGTFKAILWHQGETDVEHKMPAPEYFAKLTALIAQFRTDLNLPDVPFIIGQLGPFHQKVAAGTEAFNAKLVEFAAAQPHCACVTSEGLTTIGDNLHFDAASQRELGRRYAQAYETLSAGK